MNILEILRAIEFADWRHNAERDTAKQAADEIERLRAALAKMSDCGEHPCAFCFEMAQVAKRALEQETMEKTK